LFIQQREQNPAYTVIMRGTLEKGVPLSISINFPNSFISLQRLQIHESPLFFMYLVKFLDQPPPFHEISYRLFRLFVCHYI
jgi:hypothetical protein